MIDWFRNVQWVPPFASKELVPSHISGFVRFLTAKMLVCTSLITHRFVINLWLNVIGRRHYTNSPHRYYELHVNPQLVDEVEFCRLYFENLNFILQYSSMSYIGCSNSMLTVVVYCVPHQLMRQGRWWDEYDLTSAASVIMHRSNLLALLG